MKVEKIQQTPQNQTSFGKVYRSETLSPELFSKLMKAPAVDYFSKKCDATVDIISFLSRDGQTVKRALSFSNVVEKGFLKKVKTFLGQDIDSGFLLKTNAQTDENLVRSVRKMPKNTAFDIYKKSLS